MSLRQDCALDWTGQRGCVFTCQSQARFEVHRALRRQTTGGLGALSLLLTDSVFPFRKQGMTHFLSMSQDGMCTGWCVRFWVSFQNNRPSVSVCTAKQEFRFVECSLCITCHSKCFGSW